MSRSYLPKAAVGSLLLVGASSLLDQSDSISGSQQREEHGMDEDLPLAPSAAPSRLAQVVDRPYIPTWWHDDEEDQDEEMEFEVDTYLDQPVSASRTGVHLAGSIPRPRLHHPDETLFGLFQEVERDIRGRFPSVEDDAVDLDSIYLLVALANECFEVARESYIISATGNQTNWYEISLTWSNHRFRRLYRVSLDMFEGLVVKLELNPIFMSTGPRPQRPVRHQLATFLLRYGNGYSNAYNPHLVLSLGEGSVFNYCNRVSRALCELGLHAVAWPDGGHKAQIKAAMYRKTRLFDGCIGAVDGSLINMARKPKEQGDEYLSRKKRPCINVMAVVDHECRIIYLESGWPGSKNDAHIWTNSWLFQHQRSFFDEREYLLADKGYPLSPYIMRPFSEVEMRDNEAKKRRFNKTLSGARIKVEMAFGRLKSRFPSLHCMGMVSNMKSLYRTVEALVALHNLCIDFGDSVIEGGVDPDRGEAMLEDDRFPGHRSEDEDEFGGHDFEGVGNWMLQAGRNLRDEYLEMLD